MSALMLARCQFAVTTLFHFLFVPLTIGLAFLLAILETAYVRTGDDVYKRMVKFWGRLFLINFALGVATGIVQEFQFGMNWSEYSRFVGDIFGAPLAVESMLAFFLESTFLGVWIFGWDRLSKRMHAASMWIVSAGTLLSALWILAANSWMQNPVGYALRNGRAELLDFFALLSNSRLPYELGHVILGCAATAGFFMLGISAWHLWRRRVADLEFFRRSFRWAAVYALIGSLGVVAAGHVQGQWTVRVQPMKMAAAEALWETEDPAGLLLVACIDEAGQRNTWSLRVPHLLSFLSYNRLHGAVPGIKDVQAQFAAKHGAGNYVPPVALLFWTFRVMAGTGVLMILLALISLRASRKGRMPALPGWFMGGLVAAIGLPYVANSAGWILTEVGRQPWVVYGLMKTADAVSITTPAGAVLTSLIVFTVVYGALSIVDIWLLRRYAMREPAEEETH